jgi:hypothetical protein
MFRMSYFVNQIVGLRYIAILGQGKGSGKVVKKQANLN